MKHIEFHNGKMMIKQAEPAEDAVRETLYELAQLRTRFLDSETPEEEKLPIAEQYDALVDQLPEDIQIFHRGLVAGDVVE